MHTTDTQTLPAAERKYGLNPRTEGVNLLDFEELFGNRNDVILEIGSGKGRWLVDSAQANPSRNYLGIEKSLHYYRVIEERIRKRRLSNATIINYDAFPVLQKMLPAKSIREVNIFFPDPWPRPRERKRRMVRPEVLQEIVRVLRDDGVGYYVTDHREYFLKAVPEIQQFFETEAGEIVHQPPRTNYEEKYQREGRPIYQAKFWKRT